MDGGGEKICVKCVCGWVREGGVMAHLHLTSRDLVILKRQHVQMRVAVALSTGFPPVSHQQPVTDYHQPTLLPSFSPSFEAVFFLSVHILMKMERHSMTQRKGISESEPLLPYIFLPKADQEEDQEAKQDYDVCVRMCVYD